MTTDDLILWAKEQPPEVQNLLYVIASASQDTLEHIMPVISVASETDMSTIRDNMLTLKLGTKEWFKNLTNETKKLLSQDPLVDLNDEEWLTWKYKNTRNIQIEIDAGSLTFRQHEYKLSWSCNVCITYNNISDKKTYTGTYKVSGKTLIRPCSPDEIARDVKFRIIDFELTQDPFTSLCQHMLGEKIPKVSLAEAIDRMGSKTSLLQYQQAIDLVFECGDTVPSSVMLAIAVLEQRLAKSLVNVYPLYSLYKLSAKYKKNLFIVKHEDNSTFTNHSSPIYTQLVLASKLMTT